MLVAGFLGGVSGGPMVHAAPPLALAEFHAGANPKIRERLTTPAIAVLPVPDAGVLVGSKPAPGIAIAPPPAPPPPSPAASSTFTQGVPAATVSRSTAVPPQSLVPVPPPVSLAPGGNPRPATSALVAFASAAAPLPPDVHLSSGAFMAQRPWLTVAPTFPILTPLPSSVAGGQYPLTPPPFLVGKASAAIDIPPDVSLYTGTRPLAGAAITVPVPLVPAPIPSVTWLAPVFLAGPPLVSKLPLGVEPPPSVRIVQGATLAAARMLRVVELPLAVMPAPIVLLRVGSALSPTSSPIRVALPLLVSDAPSVRIMHGGVPVFTPVYVVLPTTSIVSSQLVTSVI